MHTAFCQILRSLLYHLSHHGSPSDCKDSACKARNQVQALSREDPLEEEMATHSSILAWEILRTAEPGELQSVGSQRVGHNWVTEHSKLLTVYTLFGFLGIFFWNLSWIFGKRCYCCSRSSCCILLNWVTYVSASSIAHCSVRPDKLKCQSLEQRKVYCRAIQETGGSY